jgi:hypothetical protein
MPDVHTARSPGRRVRPGVGRAPGPAGGEAVGGRCHQVTGTASGAVSVPRDHVMS